MKEITLPSGAVLKINAAPFEAARNLYQAVLEEFKPISISSSTELSSLYKDLFCIGFSSKKIESTLWECLKRCQYCDKRGELKIDKDTFEPIEAREDYLLVCAEVAKENINPFMKQLALLFSQAQDLLSKPQG